MALLFDQFGVRRVELEVTMFPGFSHGFNAGELSALYGQLNADDLFESCNLRANIGAEFESEHWLYDVSSSRILIRSEAFQSYEVLDKEVLHLLEETKAFLTPKRLPFLLMDRISIRGTVPESDESKDISQVLRSKLLARRISRGGAGARLLDLLPGEVAGVGLELVGDTDDFHWHARIGPSHGSASSLYLSASLYFPPPSETPEESMISDALKSAYEFLTTNVLEFAEKALT